MAAGDPFYLANFALALAPVALAPGAAPAVLYRIDGSFDASSPGGAWLQVFPALPVAGSVPVLSYYVVPGNTYSIAMVSQDGERGRQFVSSPHIALSSARTVWTPLVGAYVATVHSAGRLLA